MKFRQLVKTVDTKNFYFQMIEVEKMKAQYNPERFHLWRSLHEGPKKDPLNMLFSPHYKFLEDRENDCYYRLQRLYGRKNRWIENKIRKFLGVFESIKINGFIENVSVVEKPLVKNKFNVGYEIFEGHHRVACALALGLDVIPCEIIRRNR